MLGGLILIIQLLITHAANAETNVNVVYGDDNRVEIREVPYQWRETARSVASIFRSGKIAPDAFGYRLLLQDFWRNQRLCPGERFWDQPSGATCGGALIADDVVLTSGHCFDTAFDLCRDTFVVFDFFVKADGSVNERPSYENVYRCREVIEMRAQDTGPDFALFRLDRKVSGRKPLKVTTRPLSIGQTVAVIGNPNGLPQKFDTGKVRRADTTDSFVVNTDTFDGNSGSPVLDFSSGEIVGVLVRGEEDYDWFSGGEYSADGCNKVKNCAEDDCRGEDVTGVAAFQTALIRLGIL